MAGKIVVFGQANNLYFKILTLLLSSTFPSESDYAMLTREFEDHVDEKILEAVRSFTSVEAV